MRQGFKSLDRRVGFSSPSILHNRGRILDAMRANCGRGLEAHSFRRSLISAGKEKLTAIEAPGFDTGGTDTPRLVRSWWFANAFNDQEREPQRAFQPIATLPGHGKSGIQASSRGLGLGENSLPDFVGTSATCGDGLSPRNARARIEATAEPQKRGPWYDVDMANENYARIFELHVYADITARDPRQQRLLRRDPSAVPSAFLPSIAKTHLVLTAATSSVGDLSLDLHLVGPNVPRCQQSEQIHVSNRSTTCYWLSLSCPSRSACQQPHNSHIRPI